MSIDFKRVTTTAHGATRDVAITRVQDQTWNAKDDLVAVEEPLEIRLGYRLVGKPAQKSISVTMRTPGDDQALAVGFLFGESIIRAAGDIERFEYCGGADAESTNIVRVVVGPDVDVDVGSLQRNFYTTSSCGVCGKASLEALQIKGMSPLEPGDWSVPTDVVAGLPEVLRHAQPLFEKTGGIHAAGLFDPDGQLVALCEDVGRHNAMDKLVGHRLLADEVPLHQSIAVLSGRASFELLQKALRAQIPMVVAVGAPSSLAVDLAGEYGITLVGFTRRHRFNVYTHPTRIESPQ